MIRFLEVGRWGAAQVRMSWTPSTWRDQPAVREVIESTWREAVKQVGVKLFDGPMCRLESLSTDADSLVLQVSPISYRIFYGTNLTHADLADLHGDDVLARALGVSVGVMSADGFFLLGRRNSAVAYYPNRLHPFAGTLEPNDLPDSFAAPRRELMEELRLDATQISQIECVGVAEDRALRQPEMIFLAQTSLSRHQLSQRAASDEHSEAYSVRATASDLSQALANEAGFTPIARATLLLCGRVHLGDQWFQSQRAE